MFRASLVVPKVVALALPEDESVSMMILSVLTTLVFNNNGRT